jgi:hypothetical protein
MKGAPPKKPVEPPAKTLWDACVRVLETPPTPDAPQDTFARVRTKLVMFGTVMAVKLNQDPRQWSAYCERHLAGVRFMLRDANGREVDLQRIPGTLEELATWQPPPPRP